MIYKYKNRLLVVVILLASFLRFNQLGTLPALNADEAAIGYNAYSLIQTGRDEHGHPWPIHFESFADYKPGLFFYIVLPFVKFLGLNEWAVRVPGAALGVLTVLLVYFLVVELKKAQKFEIRNSKFEILAATLLAISPWHIHFSRGGWEVNAATSFITLGMLAFLRWNSVKSKRWMFICAGAFAASLYTYHSARVIIPLLVVGILFFYRSQIFPSTSLRLPFDCAQGRRSGQALRASKNIRIVILGVVLGAILLIPLARDILGPAGAARAQGVSILADLGVIERINVQRGEHGSITSLSALIFHNKFTNYSFEFLQNWGEHFWGEFLFLSGDEIQRNKVPDIGLLHLFQLPLLVIGVILIVRKSSGLGIILWWMIIAPTAAALTFQSPHALRAHNMVIPLTIISAFGLIVLLNWLNKIKVKYLLVTCYLLLVTFVVWDFPRYLHEYYVHLNKEYQFSSQYGLKELAKFIGDNYDKYPAFAITDKYDQPYILLLFYLKYPPSEFQNAHVLTPRDRFGFSTVRDFGKFHFEEITNWDEAIKKYKGGLIIGTDKEIPDKTNVIHRIYFPSGDIAFKVVAN